MFLCGTWAELNGCSWGHQPMHTFASRFEQFLSWDRSWTMNRTDLKLAWYVLRTVFHLFDDDSVGCYKHARTAIGKRLQPTHSLQKKEYNILQSEYSFFSLMGQRVVSGLDSIHTYTTCRIAVLKSATVLPPRSCAPQSIRVQ